MKNKIYSVSEFKGLLDNRGLFEYRDMFSTAYEWASQRNESPVVEGLEWSWDFGLKLDFDGCLISVSSRFYPPHKSHADYGRYSGTITIYSGEIDYAKKELEADTLDQLVVMAEDYVSSVFTTLDNLIRENKEIFEKI